MYVWCNIEAISCNYYCIGKAIIITYYEGVFVALGIQHAMHMLHIVICGLYPAVQYFVPCYPVKGTIFQNWLLNMKCVFIFTTIFV